MEALIKTTSMPYESVRFIRKAQLIPSDMVVAERQKALARYRSSRRFSSGSAADFSRINQIRKAFSIDSRTVSSFTESAPSNAGTLSAESLRVQNTLSSSDRAGNGNEAFDRADTPLETEISSAYTVQRGAFELRVAKGDIAYIPALIMTIVTQYPEIHFEYTGDFNYVPPREEPAGSTINTQA